jgi:hypothetical protein
MATAMQEKSVSQDLQSQMMLACAFCGETTAPPAVMGGVLTIRSREGRVGAFAFHSECAMERMHPRAQALLASAPVIPPAN